MLSRADVEVAIGDVYGVISKIVVIGESQKKYVSIKSKMSIDILEEAGGKSALIKNRKRLRVFVDKKSIDLMVDDETAEEILQATYDQSDLSSREMIVEEGRTEIRESTQIALQCFQLYIPETPFATAANSDPNGMVFFYGNRPIFDEATNARLASIAIADAARDLHQHFLRSPRQTISDAKHHMRHGAVMKGFLRWSKNSDIKIDDLDTHEALLRASVRKMTDEVERSTLVYNAMFVVLMTVIAMIFISARPRSANIAVCFLTVIAIYSCMDWSAKKQLSRFFRGD